MLQLNTPTAPPPYYHITVPLEVQHKIFQIFAHLKRNTKITSISGQIM